MSASRIDVADIWIGLEDVIQEERGSNGNPDEQYGAVQPNKSLALFLCPVKRVLVIFPNKQDSHV